MTDEERYSNALEFATLKHEGQKRKGGEPYIIHPIAVAGFVRDDGYGTDYQIAALFHDLLEDTDATEDEIRKFGNEEILTAVKLLTKVKGYNMAEYIGEIKKNDMAFQVKKADRLHNLRCALTTNKEFKRKYILETVDWYMDFSPRIRAAVKELAQSLDEKMTELSFLYEADDNWKI